MGMSSQGGGNVRRLRRARGHYRPMSDINMTPFVDVMLVLLIVFMVAAPLMTVGVPIDLPETASKPLQGDKEPLTISVDASGKIFLQDTVIALDEVVPKLKAIAENGYNQRIFVRGSARVDYGAVMKVMGTISAAGFRRIGLVTEQEQGAKDK